jgi:hypothetical protein
VARARECEFEKPAKPILFGLNALNLLQALERIQARDPSADNQPPNDLILIQPTVARQAVQVFDVLVTQTNGDPMLELFRSSHFRKSIRSATSLSSKK